MGLAIPRPAMRNREARVIAARLAFFAERKAAYIAEGRAEADANVQASIDASHLKFTRSGEVK